MLGIDIIETARIKKAAENPKFLQKAFTEREREYFVEKGGSAETLAGMWCVKEAVAKALGTGVIFPLTDIETVHSGGAPKAVLHGKAKVLLGDRIAEISITHTALVSAAVAIIFDGI